MVSTSPWASSENSCGVSCCQARGGTARAALRSARCSSGNAPLASPDAAAWDRAGPSVKAAGFTPSLTMLSVDLTPAAKDAERPESSAREKSMPRHCPSWVLLQLRTDTMPSAEPHFIPDRMYGLQDLLALLQRVGKT